MVVSTEGGDPCQETGRSCLKLVRPGDKVFLLLVACGLVQYFFGKLLVTVTDVGANFNSLVINAHLRKPCKTGKYLVLCSRIKPTYIEEIVTWLILPVVICLSQRLSHACLSINKFVL